MNNLFVMHTQYNLILSVGEVSRLKSDNNILVLFAEFTLSDEMLDSLKKVFSEMYVVSDKFIGDKKLFDEATFIRRCLKKVKQLKKTSFDRIYLSQERVFDTILYEIVKRKNRNVECIAVEEDAYYSINNKFNDANYVHKPSLKAKIKSLLMAILLIGYRYNYKKFGYCYGMSPIYDSVLVLYPDLVRRELSGKKKYEVLPQMLNEGIKAIYSNKNISYPESEKYVLIFFDLMNRYKNKSAVLEVFCGLLEQCERDNITVLMKYHPRETEKFTLTENVFEIDQIIPAEKVLLDLLGRDVTVWGNATTSCVVASKLGYNVNSVVRIDNPENITIHEKFELMNIYCVKKEN